MPLEDHSGEPGIDCRCPNAHSFSGPLRRLLRYRPGACPLHNPSFSEYAELCGAKGIRVTAREQLDDAIAEALAHDGPSRSNEAAPP